MSYINGFKIYDLSNYECILINDIISFKNLFLEKLEKDYLIFDTLGNEYKKDDIYKIEIRKKDAEYLMYNSLDFKNNSIDDNLSKKELSDKILNILNIESLLNKYLTSKKNLIQKSFKVCKEIKENSINLREEDNDDLKNFEQYFSKISNDNEEINKYINMIKHSINQIRDLSPQYEENINSIEQMLNQTIIEIEKSIKCNLKGKPSYNTEDIKELKNVFTEYNSTIKDKISRIINSQELSFNLEKKINEILIYGEKINFYINLGEIPKLYDNFMKNKKEELKRRAYFKYIYNNINDYLNSILSEEFEIRKNFFKSNIQFTNNFKIEKKTIEILNRFLDIEQEKIDKEFSDKINGNNINDSCFLNNDENIKENIFFDEDILKKLDNLKKYLNDIKEVIYSKNKQPKNNNDFELNKIDKENNINDKFKVEIEEIKNNLRSPILTELNKKNILDIIENKIIKNLSNDDKNIDDKKTKVSIASNSFNNDIYESDIFMSGNIAMFNKNENNRNESIKISKFFINTYAKFLWFYNKIFDYLSLYIQNPETKLRKEEPITLNNCIVEILNENKLLKENFTKLKDCITN